MQRPEWNRRGVYGHSFSEGHSYEYLRRRQRRDICHVYMMGEDHYERLETGYGLKEFCRLFSDATEPDGPVLPGPGEGGADYPDPCGRHEQGNGIEYH